MNKLPEHEQAIIRFLQRDAKKDDFDFNITTHVELTMFFGELHEKALETALEVLDQAGYITKVDPEYELYRLTEKGEQLKVDEEIQLIYP